MTLSDIRFAPNDGDIGTPLDPCNTTAQSGVLFVSDVGEGAVQADLVAGQGVEAVHLVQLVLLRLQLKW